MMQRQQDDLACDVARDEISREQSEVRFTFPCKSINCVKIQIAKRKQEPGEAQKPRGLSFSEE